MSNPVDVEAIERRIRAKAVRRVRGKVGLMWHLTVFVMVNLALYGIDQHFTPGTPGSSGRSAPGRWSASCRMPLPRSRAAG